MEESGPRIISVDVNSVMDKLQSSTVMMSFLIAAIAFPIAHMLLHDYVITVRFCPQMIGWLACATEKH